MMGIFPGGAPGMLELSPDHPLIKMYREWKKWEKIHSSGSGVPEPASLAELQFWGEMKNIAQARFEGTLRTYLVANPGITKESVEQELHVLAGA
jgi:hypothetical protein